MKHIEQDALLPIVLVILDGWGAAKHSKGNAIYRAKTPAMDYLFSRYPSTLLHASGKYVGLPAGQDGNSEAGHMNIGSGRVVMQDALMINQYIKDRTFFKNPALIESVRHMREHGSNMHVMGLLSNRNSAHSYPEHLFALLDFLRLQKVSPVYLHLFTDGRDTPRYSAQRFMEKLIHYLEPHEIISTVSGRFYAMDRIREWKRSEKAYNAMVLSKGYRSDNPIKAIQEAYNRNESDEYLSPTIIDNPIKKCQCIADHDSIIFFNTRSDRARQITKPFVQAHFEKEGGFKRKKILHDIKFVAFSDYGEDLNGVLTAFPSHEVINSLPFAIAEFRQLYVAEREKRAHVTYFFRGGCVCALPTVKEKIFASKRVQKYDEAPNMSLDKIEKEVLRALRSKQYEMIVVNVANPDMVGHTGDEEATIIAVERSDLFVRRVHDAVVKAHGTLFITGDHGNAEELLNEKTGEVDTEHSTNKVPFIIVHKQLGKSSLRLKRDGKLGDIAPTILQLLRMKKPKEMTGISLIKK